MLSLRCPSVCILHWEGLVPQRENYVSKATDLDSKMADSVQVEEPQRRAVGGSITTGRIHKGIKIHKFMINTSVFTSYRKTETE